MRRLIIAAAILTMGSGAAIAAPCDITYDASNPAYAGDDTSMTLTFNTFSTLINSIGTCAITFDAHSNVANNPDLFELYTADIRGDILPTPDDSAKVTVTANGRTDTRTFVSGDVPVISTFVAKDANGKISQSIKVEIVNATDPATEAFLDGVDYAIFASMTRTQANTSLNQINLAGAGLITHLDGMSGLLTGGNLAVEGDDEVGTFGAVGSYDFGVRGRYNLADGFSLLGGVSIFNFSSVNATAQGFGGALAIRYLDPNQSGSRLLVEGGVDANALTALSFTRTYNYDQTGTPKSATVTGTGTGSTMGVYGKAGVLWSVDDSNDVLVSATLKQGGLGITSYNETFSSATNPFPANLSGTTTLYTTAKASADWTSELTADVDLTASLGVGATFANGGTTASLSGNSATGVAQSTIFTEYGVRLGYTPSANLTLDGFINGTTGTGIGTHVQAGAGARLRF